MRKVAVLGVSFGMGRGLFEREGCLNCEMTDSSDSDPESSKSSCGWSCCWVETDPKNKNKEKEDYLLENLQKNESNVLILLGVTSLIFFNGG